jgi:LuxR family maltose regulon positive regulatory protein
MSRALALVDSSDESRKHENVGAAAPLLETKLYVPKSRSGLVARPRLIELLQQGAAQKLTLVAAPAGFGKTTLVAGWLADSVSENAAGWVSLDASDNEPRLFWAYVARAIEKMRPEVGTRAQPQSAPQSAEPHAIESFLATLINDVNVVDADFTLVLDD